MNTEEFKQLLHKLQPADWQAVTEGRCILMRHDQSLVVGSPDAAEVVIRCAEDTDAERLREQVLADAAQILDEYYRTHPLTREGFNHQAEKLFEELGAASFTAQAGELPTYSLFVDGGEVVAEGVGQPRHRYGAYCELMAPLPEPQAAQRAQRWLDQGEAHDRYMGMNVCRYNC